MELFSSRNSNAINVLREKIINKINRTPALTYELSSLMWDDAAKCFPTTYSFKWDGAWFNLDLITRKLYAEVSTYPNQFGATRDNRYDLTAAEFHSKALEFNMPIELQNMVSDEDWQELFNEQLQSEILKAQKILKEEQEKQEQARRISNAIVIPDKFSVIHPTMEFDEVNLELCQKYGKTSVWLIRTDGKYILFFTGGNTSQRELSATEAAWVEQQVNDCLMNQDASNWQSMVGGDHMSVKINKMNANLVDLFNETPLKKYFELQHILQKLAIYGSLSESEKNQM